MIGGTIKRQKWITKMKKSTQNHGIWADHTVMGEGATSENKQILLRISSGMDRKFVCFLLGCSISS